MGPNLDPEITSQSVRVSGSILGQFFLNLYRAACSVTGQIEGAHEAITKMLSLDTLMLGHCGAYDFIVLMPY